MTKNKDCLFLTLQLCTEGQILSIDIVIVCLRYCQKSIEYFVYNNWNFNFY